MAGISVMALEKETPVDKMDLNQRGLKAKMALKNERKERHKK